MVRGVNAHVIKLEEQCCTTDALIASQVIILIINVNSNEKKLIKFVGKR